MHTLQIAKLKIKPQMFRMKKNERYTLIHTPSTLNEKQKTSHSVPPKKD